MAKPRSHLNLWSITGKVLLVFTILIIAALIAAGAGAAIGGTALWSAKKQKSLPGKSPKLLGAGNVPTERGFSSLRVGDIIEYKGQDFVVEGVIHYDEAGHKWSMAKIVDVKEWYWLLVGLDRSGSNSKRLMQENTEIDLNAYPSELLILGDQHFNFEKRGTATTKTEGKTGTLGQSAEVEGASAHRCRWWSYQAPGGHMLLVEQWGDDYRLLVGQTVGDTDLEMMPGS